MERFETTRDPVYYDRDARRGYIQTAEGRISFHLELGRVIVDERIGERDERYVSEHLIEAKLR